MVDHDSAVLDFHKRQTQERIAEASSAATARPLVRAKPIKFDMNFTLQDYSKHEQVLQEEERLQVEYKDKIAKKLNKVFKFSICQIVAIGPLLIHALDLMQQRKFEKQVDYLAHYRIQMLKFVRANFEIYLDHFRTERVQNLLINKRMRQSEFSIFQSDWKVGVVSINEELFDIVTAFTSVLETLVGAIPVGLSSESDHDYGQERREDLLDSTLLLFYKVNELLNCSHVSPAEEESKEFMIMRAPTNEVLETLFRLTHSDKSYLIFTPEVYERIKKE